MIANVLSEYTKQAGAKRGQVHVMAELEHGESVVADRGGIEMG